MSNVNTKLKSIDGVMAYPGATQAPSDVIDRAIGTTDEAIMLTDGLISQHDEVRLGSNNTSKEKSALAKTD